MQTIDLGNLFAETMLAAAVDQIAANGLPPPAEALYVAGSSVPLIDCCDGILWTRVDAVYPTDGSGNAFVSARIDFRVPAWTYPVQAGIMWCHDNITETGDFADPLAETGFAVRDGLYREAVLEAVLTRFPGAAAPWALGYRVGPWQPIGPEGGCSGGAVTVNVISASLAATV